MPRSITQIRRALPYCRSIVARKSRSVVLSDGVARQHLVGERQTFRRHHQRDDHLHAVAADGRANSRSVACRLGERRLGSRNTCWSDRRAARSKRALNRSRQRSDQMIEQRLLVLQQPIMTAIELVDLGQPEIAAQQIGQRGPLEPFADATAIRCPARAADRRPARTAPGPSACPCGSAGSRSAQNRSSRNSSHSRKRQPAGAPLPRPAQPQLRQLQPNDRGVRQQPFAAIFGKQRQRARPRRPLRPTPRSTGATPASCGR